MRARWLLGVLLSAGPAAAQETGGTPPTAAPAEAPSAPAAGLPTAPPAPATPPPAGPATDREWEVGVGALGYVGGNFLTELEDSKKVVTVHTDHGDKLGALPYPGFGGVGGGGGISLDAAWRGIVGLEVDLLYLRDRGKGDVDGYTIEMSQWDLHVPVLLKLELPAGMVRPFLMAGPDFVIPGDTDVKFDAPSSVHFTIEGLDTHYKGKADPYIALTFGLGFEIRLPTPGVDLRIPLTLRGTYDSGVGDKGDDRESVDCHASTGCTITLKSEWEWQAAGTLGLAWYFL
jgi:hypothetical protein